MKSQLSDATIEFVIFDLHRSGTPVTGAAVRAALRARHGMSGGVERVYRLLHALQNGIGQGEALRRLETENAALRSQLDQTLQRAELAERREQAHQTKWLTEIDSLREQLRQRSAQHRTVSQAVDRELRLHQEIHRLRQRLSELDTALAVR